MAAPRRIDSFITGYSNSTPWQGGATNLFVHTNKNVLYSFFIEQGNSDPGFKKSLDGGMTWGSATQLKAGTAASISVWYDRWSGIDADLIHVVYTDSGNDDVFYRNINTASSDSLSTEYTVFAGVSTANGAALSISRMRGGNLIVVGSIDLATEIYSRKSTNTGVTWSDISAGYESAGNSDLCVVMPGWEADTNDAMMFYYDRSAAEISVKYYDDSADTWSETSIATTISLPDHTSTTLGHMAATVDLTNSQNLLVFWTAIDTANADLRCFKVTQSAQTETTANVVLNSTSDQGFCGISILPNNSWVVCYCGKSNGSNIYQNVLSINYKISTDGGATWGSETEIVPVQYVSISALFNIPIFYNTSHYAVSWATIFYAIVYNAPLAIPRASYQLGI